MPLLLLALFITPQATAQEQGPAYQQFLFAYRLLERDQYDMAGQAFDEFLRDYASDERAGDARYYRAMIFRQAGDPEAAIEQLTDAPPPTLLPAWRPNLLLGQLWADAGEPTRAVLALEQIDVADLEDAAQAEVRYHLGRAHRARENLPGAIQQFQAAAGLDSPLRPRLLLELAQSQLRFGDTAAAEATLQQAITTGDAQVVPPAARLAGDLARQAGRPADALQAYATIVNDHPDSPQFGPAVVGVLSVYAGANQHQDVVDTYQAYVTRLPDADEPAAAYLAGAALLKLNRPADAARVLAPLADLDRAYPPNDAVLYQLAQAQFQTEQYDALDQTITALDTRHPQSPRRADAVFLKAAADAARGNNAAAAERLSLIVDLGDAHPYFAQALLQRAAVHERNDAPDAALDDYLAYFDATTVAGNTPTPEQANAMLRLLYLGHTLERFDLVKGVAGEWTQTMTLDPAVREDMLYRLGLAAWVAGDTDAAARAFDTLAADFPTSGNAATVAYYRGRLLLADEDPSTPGEGVRLLTAAAESDALPATLKTEAFRLLQARALEAGDAAAAAAALQRLETVVGLDGMSEADLLWLGNQARVADQPAEAVRVLTALLDRPGASAPGRARAGYLAGLAEQARGNHDAATAQFQAVQALDAGFVLEARAAAAESLADAGRTDDALAAYRDLFSCGVSRIEAQALYESGVLEMPRELDAARGHLTRLVLLYNQPGLTPWPQRGHLRLADVLLGMNLPDEAARTLGELVTAAPADDPYALIARARLDRNDDTLAAVRAIDPADDETLADFRNHLLNTD